MRGRDSSALPQATACSCLRPVPPSTVLRRQACIYHGVWPGCSGCIEPWLLSVVKGAQGSAHTLLQPRPRPPTPCTLSSYVLARVCRARQQRSALQMDSQEASQACGTAPSDTRPSPTNTLAWLSQRSQTLQEHQLVRPEVAHLPRTHKPIPKHERNTPVALCAPRTHALCSVLSVCLGM